MVAPHGLLSLLPAQVTRDGLSYRPRPLIPRRDSIGEYSHRELVALAQWILSDTLLRTDEELMAEMRKELGFKRRGNRIDEALRKAIRDARRLLDAR